MGEADLGDISTLDFDGSRGPAGWIEWNVRNYAQHGFGLWVVETHDGGFVGDCGLTLQPVEGEWCVEIGWHVRAPLRRRGYAVEAATAVRETAQAAGIERLIAIIRPENVASRAVAQRIGMMLERESEVYGVPVQVFGAHLRS